MHMNITRINIRTVCINFMDYILYLHLNDTIYTSVSEVAISFYDVPASYNLSVGVCFSGSVTSQR